MNKHVSMLVLDGVLGMLAALCLLAIAGGGGFAHNPAYLFIYLGVLAFDGTLIYKAGDALRISIGERFQHYALCCAFAVLVAAIGGFFIIFR